MNECLCNIERTRIALFKVYVRIKDEEWNVYKRYKQFNELFAEMKKKHPLTGKFDFPPKKSFGKKVGNCLADFFPVDKTCRL